MALPARLLLVDDEESNRDLFGRRLLRLGYQVEMAENGYQALEMLHSRPYDLVLLDHMMPGINGLEVLRLIREKWSASVLPVIMVTAIGESANVVCTLRLGANDYVTKPVDFPIAMARIETQLQLAFADREVRRAHDFYQLALRASEEGLWDWDFVAGKLYYSGRWKCMLGLSDDEVSGSPEEWFGRIHPDDRARVSAQVQAHVEGHTTSLATEYRMRHKDGRYRWMENRGSASRDATGQVIRMAGYQSDITARKTIDPVTALPNRTWLDQELGAIAAEGRRAALLLLDLDFFDRIEESLPSGGAIGFVAAVAARLRDSLGAMPGGVTAVVVRSGEHQFGVLLRDASGPGEARQLADRLQAALRAPFLIGEEPVFVTACVGIAVSYGDEPGDHLLRGANEALRHAREPGAGRCEVFQNTMRQQDLAELRLENDLRHALERSEFVVYYQPKVDLASGRIVGFEALVRWNRPGYGLVQPNDFILTAERTGMIVPLGRYVLERACRDTAELRRSFPGVGVSVNVSGRQLAEPDLVDHVRECLDSAGLEPSALRLEITETFLVEDPEKAFGMLSRLRGMGVGLKLDDFGSGYSSLNYLQRFPFDTLKVDRSFVSHLPESHESAEIVRAVTGLARSLNMHMVAEGIETQAQAEWLRDLGCHYGQGYWFSPPVELARLRELLERWPPTPMMHPPTRPEIGDSSPSDHLPNGCPDLFDGEACCRAAKE
ncbi:MAG: EAL domain-containing protein [Acidobacteriia bacterium]|nr:EAL domain-containing protein [Terriglobia bacterium]